MRRSNSTNGKSVYYTQSTGPPRRPMQPCPGKPQVDARPAPGDSALFEQRVVTLIGGS